MSSPLPEEEVNPYAAPKAEIGEAIIEPGDAEAIRRAYLEHETTVKAVGSLHFVGGVIVAFVSVFVSILIGVDVEVLAGRVDLTVLVGLTAVVGSIGLNVALGLGLTRLRAWARWTEVVLAGIGLAGVAVGLATLVYFERPVKVLVVAVVLGLLPGFVLYLLLSRKGAIIFSREYRAIVAKTPHVKYRAGRTETSLMGRIALGLIVSLLLMFLLSFFILG